MSDLPECPGVYLLTHDVTGDTYVGCGINIQRRVRWHYAALANGTHPNVSMTRLAQAAGVRFSAKVLQTSDAKDRQRVESHWITSLRPTLNRQGFDGARPIRAVPSITREQVNFRLKTVTVEKMERFKDQHPLKPTLTQIVEAAVSAWLEAQQSEMGKSAKK